MAIVMADDGAQFDPDLQSLSIAYNEDGTVAHIQVRVGSREYRQSFVYVAGKLSAMSGWTKQ